MFSFFKRKKSKSSRGVSYYDRENIVHTIKDLGGIFNYKSISEYTTDKIIKFNGLALSNINKQNVLKVFNKPDCTINKLDNIDNYEILFYRHSLEKFTFLMQFHFYDDKFLFVSNMVNSSGIISKAEKQSFIQKIDDKYFLESNIDFDEGLEVKIIDKNDNFISVVDGVNFRVNYLNKSSFDILLKNNPDILKKLGSYNKEDKIDDYF